MQTKFFKGQRAVHSEFGEGVIELIDSLVPGTPISFDHAKGRMWFTADGRVTPNSPVTLRPIEAARTVHTGWQRKRIEDLTKREYFAAMAMQGVLANSALNYGGEFTAIVEKAVACADALLSELDKTETK